MLELVKVSKTVNEEEHLKDISLTFGDGSLNILLGATLAGKTSLLRIMAGLDKPTHGQVIIDGQDVTGVPVRRRNIAMVYQQFINYPGLSVYENIASPLKVAGMNKESINQKVVEAAQLLQLEPYLKRKPLELSGGQQQRTALARAIVKNARLVLLDEPLANLDYKLREELRVEIPKIFAKSGSIFVYATTEPYEALQLGGYASVLYQGSVIQFGVTNQVYRAPKNFLAAKIFSDPPLNIVKLQKRGANFSDGGDFKLNAIKKFSSLADGDYLVGFRPHNLALHAQSSKSIMLELEVKVSEITGSQSFVHLTYQGQEWVMLVPGVHAMEVGQKITVFCDTGKLFLFNQQEDLINL